MKNKYSFFDYLKDEFKSFIQTNKPYLKKIFKMIIAAFLAALFINVILPMIPDYTIKTQYAHLIIIIFIIIMIIAVLAVNINELYEQYKDEMKHHQEQKHEHKQSNQNH